MSQHDPFKHYFLMANKITSRKYKIINLTLPMLLDICVVSIFFSEIHLKLYFFSEKLKSMALSSSL